MANIYLKNKSGNTLHQSDTGLANDWLNGTVIDALANHHSHQLYPIGKLRTLLVAGDIAVTEDAAGTVEKGLAHSLDHFQSASLAQVDDKLEEATDFERVANKGVADGYAELDATGRVPSGQLPSGLGGGVTYKGIWDANTNTPTLSNGVGTDGDMYKVSVAGTTSIDGNSSWAVGDQIIFGSGSWDKIDNTESISSVFGRTGAITAQVGDYDKTDVGLDQVDNTADLNKPVSVAAQTALDSKQDASEKGQPNGYAGLDALGNIPAGNVTNDLDSIMENGSVSNVSSPIDIQTAASANIQSSGAMSVSGSSYSTTSTGSQTESFYEKVSSATIPNGTQVTYGTTVEVTGDTAVYDSEVGDDSFIRKEMVESLIATASGGSGNLGDIKASGLSEAQMSSQSSLWVLADGRSVTGSAYHTLTGNANAPDLRGQFLRGLDTSGTTDPDGSGRTLGDTQGDATALNGLQIRVRSEGSSGMQHGSRDQVAGANNNDAQEGWQQQPLRSTDSETRPTNVSVNYFIKIN